jgi:beta-lactamase regulating signal transducer with metallopeptidase domain
MYSSVILIYIIFFNLRYKDKIKYIIIILKRYEPGQIAYVIAFELKYLRYKDKIKYIFIILKRYEPGQIAYVIAFELKYLRYKDKIKYIKSC